MSKKALLFINGTPPENLPFSEGYDCIACTDGALHYLKEKEFPLEKLNFISGDFDSHVKFDPKIPQEKFIFTPDQDFTDFQKALDILQEKGILKIDVYGASGREQDHFLGNLHAAFLYKEKMNITFFDHYSTYFFIENAIEIANVKGKTISLIPFPTVENITTKGLKWELQSENLSIISRIGTRNSAQDNLISIEYESGNLLLFISQ